jgi:hypothetical protein
VTTISTVGTEKLAPIILQGKKLFYDAPTCAWRATAT